MPPKKPTATLEHQAEAETTADNGVSMIHCPTCGAEQEDHDVCGHDFEGFVAELDAYGPWQASLREMHAHVEALPLLDAIEDAAADRGHE